MNKHLTLDDRMEIQMGLKAGDNFSTIASRIDSKPNNSQQGSQSPSHRG